MLFRCRGQFYSAAPEAHFGGTLTYLQHSTGDYPLGVGDGIHAEIVVFTLPVSTIDAGDTPQSSFEALSGVFNQPGFALLGNDYYDDEESTPSGVGSLGVTVTLNPGDSIWIRVLLQTPAPNGSWVDSSRTLITHWDVATDLVPAAIAVPVPATAALLALGLLAMPATMRRRRSASAH